jgi:DeoR/GlpR family transcriptional regulator of sugar metabolism
MLKRERQAYFPYRVNLYYSVLTTDLSQHTTRGGKCFIGKSDLNFESRQSNHDVIHIQNALVEGSQKVDCLINFKKFNSQQPVQVRNFSEINTLINKLSPGELKHQLNLAAIQML